MPSRSAKGGRPPVDRPTGRKVTLYLLPDVEAKAKAIGDGNLSGGVSKAVRKYRAATSAGAVQKCDTKQ
jgi:hypothetical protein